MEVEENLHQIKWQDYSDYMYQLQKSIYGTSNEYDTLLISAEGNVFKSHRIILSGSSDFFHMLLKDVPTSDTATLYMPDIQSNIMELLLSFMYLGEVNMPMLLTSTFLDMCNYLQIKGIKAVGITLRNARESEEQTTTIIADPLTDSENGEEPTYLVLDDEYDTNGYVNSEEEIAIEYLDSEANEDNSNCDYGLDAVVTDLTVEAQDSINNDADKMKETVTKQTTKLKKRSATKRFGNQRVKAEIDRALNEISTGKTIHQLSMEYKVPRSTLYHKFRTNDNLKTIYRSERKMAMQQAVSAVIDGGLSLTKAAERFLVPKTGIWRELRKTEDYHAPTKDLSEIRLQAQNEIIEGKSLTSISMKYGIPLTTVHRDKKRLSKEGKLPDSLKIKDRTENSEYGKRLEQALESCRQGMSQYQASKMYNIPKATMWRYANALFRNNAMDSHASSDGDHLKLSDDIKIEKDVQFE